MDPAADRYRTWLESHPAIREGELLRLPRPPREIEVQARWFAGEFGRHFTAADGRPVAVVQFGVWNREAGPDFVGAAVAVADGPAVRGAIEIDADARDWERHGHATNPDYRGVVLHLFWRRGANTFFTRTADHRNVPQVLLDPADVEPPAHRQRASHPPPGRCQGVLAGLAAPGAPAGLAVFDAAADGRSGRALAVVEMAARHRLKQRGDRLALLAAIHGPDEALYQALAETLGYKANRLPFRLLAQRLPLKMLREQRADAEALLFGVAGFLATPDLAAYAPDTRARLRDLWDRWWPHRNQCGRLTLPADLWRAGAQRPANHPQRRLAALALIVNRWPRIRPLGRAFDARQVRARLADLHDPYWDFHYTIVSPRSPTEMALVGPDRAADILVNVLYPIALREEPGRWPEFAALAAPQISRRARLAADRLLGDTPLARRLLRTAWGQQGLLQLDADFCGRDASDCQCCPLPELAAGLAGGAG